MEQSGDNRATQFLIQKVANDVQRGNAASVMATIPSSQDWEVCLSDHYVAGYRIFKNRQNLIFVLLPDCLIIVLVIVPIKARGQTKQRMATILRHNNKLTCGMCLLGFRRV